MKLYVLQHNGIVKIGITKHEDTNIRLSQINNHLPKDKKFELICDFEVPDNAAMIERLIHEYLGINQLNIQYLKNQMVLVNVDYLQTRHEGYTEFFLADKDKVRQAITLFGILDYIKVTPEQLEKLDNIQAYAFDFLADKYPEFLKLCEPINKLKEAKQKNNKTSLTILIKNLENQEIYADFCIENNQFYLTLNEHKISIEDLTDNKYIEDINNLLSNKNLIPEKKEIKSLYSLIRELRANNKETSIQPLTSMQKELKEYEFYEFMENHNGYKKVREIISEWDTNEGIIPFELLGEDSNIKNNIIKIMSYNDIEEKYLKSWRKEIKILEDKNIFQANFNSPLIFPDFYNFINKSKFLVNISDECYDITLQNTSMVICIFKILYNSKDKKEEIKQISNFIHYVDNFYNSSVYRDSYLRNNKNPLSTKQLESLVISSIKNSDYINLAEACISVYGYSKSEKAVINRIKHI